MGVLKNLAKFTRKDLQVGGFFNIVAGLSPATLLKRLQHWCFFLRTPIFLYRTLPVTPSVVTNTLFEIQNKTRKFETLLNIIAGLSQRVEWTTSGRLLLEIMFYQIQVFKYIIKFKVSRFRNPQLENSKDQMSIVI